MDKPVFCYTTSRGSGTATLRMREVHCAAVSDLAQQIEHLVSDPEHEVVVEGEGGSRITLARISKSGGLWAGEYKYALIYEGEKPSSYSVFYLTRGNQIIWVAGPKSITFERAWREFRAGLQ